MNIDKEVKGTIESFNEVTNHFRRRKLISVLGAEVGKGSEGIKSTCLLPARDYVGCFSGMTLFTSHGGETEA